MERLIVAFILALSIAGCSRLNQFNGDVIVDKDRIIKRQGQKIAILGKIGKLRLHRNKKIVDSVQEHVQAIKDEALKEGNSHMGKLHHANEIEYKLKDIR
jgi:outer membrane lipoprotein SlyB